jgi:predicted RecB family nuclease
MRIQNGQVRLSATDLSGHLACRHLSTLDLQVARGERTPPLWAAPDLRVIQELGLRHETAYLKFLEEERKLSVVSLGQLKNESEALERTRRLMDEGAEVIAQGALGHQQWFGRPDVLLRVEAPGGRWKWSYQVQDTKLAKQTKATTILQLSLYSELLEQVQERGPDLMWVITPGTGFAGECYRVADYSAYFRYVKRELLGAVGDHRGATYPEPVAHCEICRWFRACDAKRRGDDHLSLVAGIRRQQRVQLEEWKTDTTVKLAVLPIPLRQKPKHGSREGIERVREQARVQVAGRLAKKPVHERLPVAEGAGFARLPEPSRGDLFVDLEGDPFAGESGQQYLFGFVSKAGEGGLLYEKRWTLKAEDERGGFEWLMDEIMRRWREAPGMHVYHFGANEPSTFKRLMGRYATREEEMDGMLRAGLFVDLHRVVKQSLRASVEEYSLKELEAFHGFERKTSLDQSRQAMRYIEHRLELERIDQELPQDIQDAMEGYNREDCLSTAALREWLEQERGKLIAEGAEIPRPALGDPQPSEQLDEQQKRVAALFKELTAGLPSDAKDRGEDQQAQWLLAQLLDWHRRESKADSWRYYELLEMDDADLLDENDALAGLVWIGSVESEDGGRADRYAYPSQETKIRKDKEVHHKGRAVGTVQSCDPVARTIDIKQTRDAAGFRPTSIFVKEPYRKPAAQQGSLYRLGCWVRDHGMASPEALQAGYDLLTRHGPRLQGRATLQPGDVEEFPEEACRIIHALDRSCLAIQGPPGSGKTTTAAQAIRELVRRGKQVGVAGPSHKVIRLLLERIGRGKPAAVRRMHKCDPKDLEDDPGEIVLTSKNPIALSGLERRTVDVLGGTSWLWSREEFRQTVDYLFVDEAGQMSLADVLAMSQAAQNLVLLGDPQQLPLPQKGSHPDGAEASALGHMLRDRKLGQLTTMPPDRGLFIAKTNRLHPRICEYTSTLFYAGRLFPRSITERRVLSGHAWLAGAGLWFVPVAHQGNRNSSVEERKVVERIVASLKKPSVRWSDEQGREAPLASKDILIIAPYNAQVSDLSEKLAAESVGTVDKFQGQEAPVVIYSLTTSSPEDAPRGMEFLYSLNRLNVATSRAKSAVILVGSPKLFEPECRSPRQMQLANALCRYLEMAQIVSADAVLAD